MSARRELMRIGLEFLRRLELGLDPKTAARTMGMEAPGFTNIAPFMAKWAQSGFPCVEPSAKLAASFAATSIAEDHADAMIVPWPCFAVGVPGATVTDHAGRPIDLILFTECDPRDVGDDGGSAFNRFNMLCMSGLLPIAFSSEPALGGFCNRYLTGDIDDGVAIHESGGVTVVRDEHQAAFESRFSLATGRILAGTIAELTDPRFSKAIRVGPVAPKLKRGEPRSWVIRMTRDVRVDCREWLREYLSGTGKKLTVQSMVRGHWKRQPAGPGGLERRLIHVEPYWRGPEDAPIAVRSHRFGDS